MNRILLLASNERHRHRLADWLSARYDVLFAAGPTLPAQRFDLCIVDAGALVEHGAWLKARKEDAFPVALPVLFLGSGEDLVNEVPRPHWQTVDELLSPQAQPLEVQYRLGTLLQNRQATLDLKMEHERLLFTSKAIESISDAIIIADVDGTAIYNNQAFVDLYGYTVNELNVRGISASLFTNPQIAVDIFAAMREGRTWTGEVELKTKGTRSSRR